MFLRFIFLFLVMLPTAMAGTDARLLSSEVLKRFKKVPEFLFIQEEANKLGVKVYLFGGTASAFAHYVRWDLERETGDDKYQKERFDYDFTNIYRGNQDLDIVVDGTAEQAAQLEQILKEKYPHFVGNKTAWEVRLLQAKIGDKLPLLDNYDFLNQHTDTNSTGMLAVNPDEGEIVFRDLFSWDDSRSQFLTDVANGGIKFLFSEEHKTTSRAKEGKNPPIFAAVRYLAKLAQYEVKGAPGDLDLIKKIIKETNWVFVKSNYYLKHKLEEFGKKVLLNAPDSEYAWDLLEDTGLRKRLIEMDGSRINEFETLSWWMNKEPLRSKTVGVGNGKTAAEIFKDKLNENGELVVAHETKSFMAYENITRSSKGRANVFISRVKIEGEMAAFGNGFYTRVGFKGAVGTGITIRFKLDPQAREGSDFIYSNDFIVVQNKNALTLIQENLNISMVDFLKLVELGELSSSDKGLIEKFKRKFDRINKDSFEYKAAADYVREAFFIDESFPGTSKDSVFSSFEEMLEILMNKQIILNEVFSGVSPGKNWREALKKSLKYERKSKLMVEHVFSQRSWVEVEETQGFIDMVIDEGKVDDFVIEYILSKEWWRFKTEWVDKIIAKDHLGKNDELILSFVLENNDSFINPSWIKTLIGRSVAHFDLVFRILPDKRWTEFPELIEKIIVTDWKTKAQIELDEYYRSLGRPFENVDESALDEEIKEYIFTEKHWREHPEFIAYLGGKEVTVKNLREEFKKVDFVNWLANYRAKNSPKAACRSLLSLML